MPGLVWQVPAPAWRLGAAWRRVAVLDAANAGMPGFRIGPWVVHAAGPLRMTTAHTRPVVTRRYPTDAGGTPAAAIRPGLGADRCGAPHRWPPALPTDWPVARAALGLPCQSG
ncbi:MAG: hypothetical protein IPI20_18600 [Rhodoferax sp.]|nr:hypothetical protein [Rhodoferax sp.]